MSRDSRKQAGPVNPAGAGSTSQFAVENFQAILDAIPEAVLAVDARQRIMAINQAAAELLDQPLMRMMGRPVCDIFLDEPCPSDLLEQTISSSQPIRDFQTSIRFGDGMLGQILIRTVPLHGPGGAPTGAALILKDVTELTALRKEVSQRYRLGRIIGKNSQMQRLYRLIEDVAASDASVLVRGESGTGKELVARAIHFASGRAGGPFVEVNCSALSEGLLESELFGHVKGAFTGAVRDRRGRFEEAHGGTLFLDEIGDVSPAVQVKLLRVLQERSIEKVGDNRPVAVDVRVISATNKDLERLLASGRMREDFYYRIKVISLDMPPLRARRGDIPLLVAHLLAEIRGRPAPDEVAGPEGIPETGAVSSDDVSPEATRLLMRHPWPGNVRELKNALEHAIVLCRGDTIRPEHLPPEIGAPVPASRLGEVPKHSGIERELIAAALARTGWNRSRAARHLGIDRTTLWRKIREYDLKPAEEPE
jgi:PAS domain S-box-containing protein